MLKKLWNWWKKPAKIPNLGSFQKYPGASSTDILGHLKPSLQKAPEKIIIHAGTNDIYNNINYLRV